MSDAGGIRIEVALSPQRPEEELAAIRAGLTANPRWISPRYFYDDRGSELFEAICELPEYYQTRTERKILADSADAIVAESGAGDLVELGSGASTKTRVLLDAIARAGRLRLYVPFDVSEGIVRRVVGELVGEYPGLRVHGVIGDFMTHLDRIPEGRNRLCIFLGGTIGNFRPPEAAAFLREVAAQLNPGEYFLLGTDLIKEVTRIEAAYDDAQGVTAEFNLNALRVLNRLLGGDFDLEGFEHHAFYRTERHRIEMWLRSVRAQTVHLPRIDLDLELAQGEEIRTEISTKYDRPMVEALLAGAGFTLTNWMTDPANLFALSLARREGA